MKTMGDGEYWKTDKHEPSEIFSYVENYGINAGKIVDNMDEKLQVGVLIDAIIDEDREKLKEYVGNTNEEDIRKYLESMPESGFSSKKPKFKPYRILKVFAKKVRELTIVGFENEVNNGEKLPDKDYERIVKEVIKKFGLTEAEVDDSE